MVAHSIVRPPTSIVACVPLIHRTFSILSYPSRSGSGNEYFHSRERIAPSMYVVIFISREPGMQLNCHPGATDAGSYPSFRFFKISTPTGIPVVWNWRSTLWTVERTRLPSLVLAHASPQGGVLCCPDRFTAGADNLNLAVLPVPSEQPPLQVLLHACKRRRYRGRKRSATDREDPAARIPSHPPSGMRLNQLQSCTVPARVRSLS